jgi:hypothetical protein
VYKKINMGSGSGTQDISDQYCNMLRREHGSRKKNRINLEHQVQSTTENTFGSANTKCMDVLLQKKRQKQHRRRSMGAGSKRRSSPELLRLHPRAGSTEHVRRPSAGECSGAPFGVHPQTPLTRESGAMTDPATCMTRSTRTSNC